MARLRSRRPWIFQLALSRLRLIHYSSPRSSSACSTSETSPDGPKTRTERRLLAKMQRKRLRRR